MPPNPYTYYAYWLRRSFPDPTPSALQPLNRPCLIPQSLLAVDATGVQVAKLPVDTNSVGPRLKHNLPVSHNETPDLHLV